MSYARHTHTHANIYTYMVWIHSMKRIEQENTYIAHDVYRTPNTAQKVLTGAQRRVTCIQTYKYRSRWTSTRVFTAATPKNPLYAHLLNSRRKGHTRHVRIHSHDCMGARVRVRLCIRVHTYIMVRIIYVLSDKSTRTAEYPFILAT